MLHERGIALCPVALLCSSVVGNSALVVSGNGISGTLPDGITVLTSLRYLSLGNNQMNGTLPSSLGLLTGLWTLDVSGNQLTGTIPSSLGSYTALSYVRVWI